MSGLFLHINTKWQSRDTSGISSAATSRLFPSSNSPGTWPDTSVSPTLSYSLLWSKFPCCCSTNGNGILCGSCQLSQQLCLKLWAKGAQFKVESNWYQLRICAATSQFGWWRISLCGNSAASLLTTAQKLLGFESNASSYVNKHCFSNIASRVTPDFGRTLCTWPVYCHVFWTTLKCPLLQNRVCFIQLSRFVHLAFRCGACRANSVKRVSLLTERVWCAHCGVARRSLIIWSETT